MPKIIDRAEDRRPRVAGMVLSLLLLRRRIRPMEIVALLLSYLGIVVSLQQEVCLTGADSLTGMLRYSAARWPMHYI